MRKERKGHNTFDFKVHSVWTTSLGPTQIRGPIQLNPKIRDNVTTSFSHKHRSIILVCGTEKCPPRKFSPSLAILNSPIVQ